ncbi:MAG: TlyA family RNA methyltransferase [Phycisphaerales bacterium]|nr:TlyA family RNA methyltransferase [Phycisphaerales bacterium]MCB9857086.1 TlyA family RNA methyltransferase [Phycisphaerales bacterium]MCB9861787.1 TlyA family RNA methyltransferase [Phycisphaerales bacterium]
MDDSTPSRRFVSRAGEKLRHALDAFDIDPTGFVCADLGSNVGGFVDCLLQAGAKKVFAVERGYGVVDYSLRNDSRVVVKERTDARLVRLPELCDLVTIDAGWTRQSEILPAAARLLKPGGRIVSLIKPHYEAPADVLNDGVVDASALDGVLAHVREAIAGLTPALRIVAETESPILGQGGNREFLWLLDRVGG